MITASPAFSISGTASSSHLRRLRRSVAPTRYARGVAAEITILSMTAVGLAAVAVLSGWDGISLRWSWVAVAVAAEAVSVIAFSTGPRVLAQTPTVSLRWTESVATTLAGNAIAATVPVVGPQISTGFVYREYQRHGADRSRIAWALAVNGMASTVAFGVLLAVGARMADDGRSSLAAVAGSVISIAPVAVIAVAVRVATVRARLTRAINAATSLLPHRDRGSGSRDRSAGGSFLDRLSAIRLTPRLAAAALGLAVLNWTADLGCLAAAAAATGHPLAAKILLMTWVAGATATTLRLTPGGLGVVESAMTGVLLASGLSTAEAVSAVLAYRAVSFWLLATAGWGVHARRTVRRWALPDPPVGGDPAPSGVTTMA